MDEKRTKVERASNLLDNYKKSKKPETSGRSDYRNVPAENPYETSSVTSDKHTQDLEKHVLKLDSPTLKRRTDQFESLSKKIKNLQDELSEKSERITALEVQNEVLRKGNGDGMGISPRDGDRGMIKELRLMVDARDTVIQQLTDSLQKRSEELQVSILREKELAEEIHKLQQGMNAMTKHTEKQLSQSYSETMEYKAKVELMSSQIQKYSEMVESLRTTLETSNKELVAKKEELDVKEKKLEKYKSEVSEDIKKLMRQVETLNRDLTKKEEELIKSKKEVETLRGQMEEQFGAKISDLKAELENKYAEDVKKVEALFDGMLLKHIRKSDEQMKAVEECSNLEDQIKSFRDLYGKEIHKYEEELQTLRIKSKAIEDKLAAEVDMYKQEADHYRQQVENFQNIVAEEVEKVQRRCFKELNQYESQLNQEKNKYEIEMQKLSQKLRDCAITEATNEVELESYKKELDKLQQYVSAVEENFKWSKSDFERQKSELLSKVTEYQNKESLLMEELKMNREKIIEYENKVHEFNEMFEDQAKKFYEKHENVVHTFEEQIQNLMNELERTKACSEAENSRSKSIMNEKDNQIKNLEAKLNYLNILKSNKANDSSTTELFSDQDSLQEQLEQINALKNNMIMAEKYEKANTEFLFRVLCGIKEVKTLISRFLVNNTGELPPSEESAHSECNAGNYDQTSLVEELEKTINDVINMTQNVDPRKMSNFYTSTPRPKASTDNFSDPSCIKEDPGNNLIRKCELLEAENVRLTKKLEILARNFKEMEYCFYLTSKESCLFDEKCKDLNAKITELENLKFSEFMLKKENNELKERMKYVEESERNIRKQFEDLVENNIKLEKSLNNNLVDLQKQVSNNGPNINLEAVLSDLEVKSKEVVSLRSQLSAVQNALKDNQERMMQLKAQCDKFIAEHDFMMSEVKTKQKELEDVWKERNELSTENKMLYSKLMSLQGKSSWDLHKIPSSVRSSSTSAGVADSAVIDEDLENCNKQVSINEDDFGQLHSKRLHTMHLLAESIAMSSKTNIRDSSSNLSVASRIDLELQEIDEMFDDTDHQYMPTITEEEEEIQVFFEHMAHGDQPEKDKVDQK